MIFSEINLLQSSKNIFAAFSVISSGSLRSAGMFWAAMRCQCDRQHPETASICTWPLGRHIWPPLHPGPASLRNTLEQGEIVEEGHDKLSLDAVTPGGRRVESGLEKNTEVAAVKVRCHTWYHHQVLTADEPLTDKRAMKETSILPLCVFGHVSHVPQFK